MPNKCNDPTRKLHPTIRFSKYASYLQLAQSRGYEFITYSEVEQKNQFIILRHDIDLDLPYATKMAQAEFDLGIKAHYFVMLHNDLYNPFGFLGVHELRKIYGMGHTIGLHFDPKFWDIHSREELLGKIEIEIDTLSNLIGHSVFYVSFHQPSPLLLNQEISSKRFESVYDHKYTQSPIRYIADSRGMWREESIDELLLSGKSKKIHFLAHPALWMNEEADAIHDRLHLMVEDQQSRLPYYVESAVNNSERNVVLYRSRKNGKNRLSL